MKKITVFTPTFNRAYCLYRLYESLKKQTNSKFIWLIVDDGSSDNTLDLVKKWMSEGIVEIEYKFKENGGMHTAHNLAYRSIKTELNVCIDSDDAMPENAIENILDRWNIYKHDKNIAGMIGLDVNLDGEVIGTRLPVGIRETTLDQLYQVYKIKGDKKLVIRTDVIHEYPLYPEFLGERLVPLDTLYTLIGQKYKFIPINEIWCLVDYQPDGSSASVIKQYFQSPRGFRYSRVISYENSLTFKNKVRNAIHFNISNFILKDYEMIAAAPNAILSFLMVPVSFLIYIYLKVKVKNV